MSKTAVKAPTPAPTFSQKSTVSQVLVLFSGKGTPLMQCFGSFHTYKVSFQTESIEQTKSKLFVGTIRSWRKQASFRLDIFSVKTNQSLYFGFSDSMCSHICLLYCPLDCDCRFRHGKRASSSLLIFIWHSLVWTGIVNRLCLLWRCLSTVLKHWKDFQIFDQRRR